MMNTSLFLILSAVLIVVFTAMILIPLLHNPVWWIHDYPADIQEVYFQTHARVPHTIQSKTVLLKKGCALLLALGILLGMTLLCGASSFGSGFGVSYGFWSVGNWYDCFILDWIFFANIKKVRLPGTEHMHRAYHQKWYHFRQALIGSILGLVPALACGAIIWITNL